MGGKTDQERLDRWTGKTTNRQQLVQTIAAVEVRLAELRKLRDPMIRRALASGKGPREVGRMFDLTHGAIIKIRDKGRGTK
jgi:hypothetical protein